MEYVLPIRTTPDAGVGEVADYARRLSCIVNVIVVDGSDPRTAAAHAERFTGVTHVPVRPDLRFLNGKVNGVVTGLALCGSDKVVIADDDVRYTPEQLERIGALLDGADVVRPQNYFRPAPWHACWDTARSLLNRAFGGGDYPGTLALRLTDRLRREGYDGDVLFENLELIRTVRAAGGRALLAPDLYVLRRPPTVRHFLRQRVRQAYDSQAQPLRLVGELMLLPGAVLAARRPRWIAGGCLLAVGVAELGRRRCGGAAYFPRSAPLYAPLWLGERAVCSWAALGARLVLGGTSYSGRRIRCAAHSVRTLRARQRQRCGATASGPAR